MHVDAGSHSISQSATSLTTPPNEKILTYMHLGNNHSSYFYTVFGEFGKEGSIVVLGRSTCLLHDFERFAKQVITYPVTSTIAIAIAIDIAIDIAIAILARIVYLDTDVIVKGDAEVSAGLVYRLTT